VTAVDRVIIEAVAAGKVVRNTVLLAKRRLEQLDAKAATLPDSAKHHEKHRRAEQPEREEMSAEIWTVICVRSRLDHRGALACELCDKPFVSYDRAEPHHLEYGSGNRTQKESVGNVMIVHGGPGKCHDKFHERPRNFVAKVKAWCAEHGYPLPNRKEYRDVP